MGKLAWLCLLATVWLAACATEPEAPPVAAPEVAKPISSVEPAVPAVVAAPKPAPKPAHPKARRKDKAAEKAAAEKALAEKAAAEAKPASDVPESVRTEPVAKAQVIKGPAWLARCASKSREGGVILCDADSLLVQPSPSVKVYTREAALAGKVASGVIVLRANLPRRYRIYFVP
ncbi:hypothetical protein [Niveibacterium terrae]|uniref:hypothetical protein n=1 Tax=Niveibacterium terrae TaxID=3373598 RepID=UPI003A94FF79